MLIKIQGSRNFKNQVMTQLQIMEQSGYFSYTDEFHNASIVVSEGVVDISQYPRCYSKIEVIDETDKDTIIFQCVCNKKPYSYPLKDFNAVLKSTILLTSILCEKDKEIDFKDEQLLHFMEEDKEQEINLKNSRMVQFKVMNEALKISGFETDLVYIPKGQVSGDFVISEEIFDKIFIFFGDVTGHGSYSGTYGVSLISLAKGFLRNASPMMANIRSLTNYMSKAAFFYHAGCEMSSAEVIFCEIDLKKNIASFCTFGGGTISPLIIRQNGKVEAVYTLENCECVLPRIGDTLYEDDDAPQPEIVTVGRFKEGDSILFYTDGITELFSKKKDGMKDFYYTYGPGNMITAIKDVVSLSGNHPEIINKAIISDVTSYGVRGLDTGATLESVINDDATLFCIRRKETESR